MKRDKLPVECAASARLRSAVRGVRDQTIAHWKLQVGVRDRALAACYRACELGGRSARRVSPLRGTARPAAWSVNPYRAKSVDRSELSGFIDSLPRVGLPPQRNPPTLATQPCAPNHFATADNRFFAFVTR
jgi:hypothetical protein